MKSRSFHNAEAFKASLEARLQTNALKVGQSIQRVRQRAIFERFLARIVQHFGDRAVLKGGVALELQLSRARMTGDVDLAFYGSPIELHLELQRAGHLELGDFMTFEIAPHAVSPTIDGPGVNYDGFRFQALARLAGKRYGNHFGVDIAFGDRMAIAPSTLVTDELFSFAGIPPLSMRVYAREVHVAEKLHAYTLPRDNENSRVKDLPDIVALAGSMAFQSKALRQAIEETFDHRRRSGGHEVPNELQSPPPTWRNPYARMAAENALPWPTLDDVFNHAERFLNPVLANVHGTWNPNTWSWLETTP